MPAGRPTAGPKHARSLDGSERARRRLEVILETLSGEKTIADACEELGINEARFHVIRKQALQAAVERLEPQPTGRRPKAVDPAAEEIARLQAELARKEADLRLAEVKAELALTMPHLVEGAAAKKKKTSSVRSRLKLKRSGKRSSKA